MDRAGQLRGVGFLVRHAEAQVVPGDRDRPFMQSGPPREFRRQPAQVGKDRRELLVVEGIHRMQWWRKMRRGISAQKYSPRQRSALRGTRARIPLCQQGAETVAEE